MGWIGERYGGGKFKMNLHHGLHFVNTKNFKPAGEPRWAARAGAGLDVRSRDAERRDAAGCSTASWAAVAGLEAAIDGRKPFDEIMELDAEVADRHPRDARPGRSPAQPPDGVSRADRRLRRRAEPCRGRRAGSSRSFPRSPRRSAALGLADALVGVTVYCVEPRDVVRGKTRIGGEKDPDLDAIRALAAGPGHRQHRGERARARRHAARAGASRCGSPIRGRWPRALAMIRELGEVTGTADARRARSSPTWSRSTRACGRRPPRRAAGAGLLPDLARAVDDDQRRHLHPRPAGGVRRGQRLRRPRRSAIRR